METTPFLGFRSAANFIVLENGFVRSFPLDERRIWSLGRIVPGTEPDIPFNSKIVSRSHGRLISVDGDWYFEHLSRTNGTYHNGIKINYSDDNASRTVKLKDGDILRIDSDDFDKPEARGVWMMYSKECIGNRWFEANLNRAVTTFGREKDVSDIVIPLPYVSAKHFMVSEKDNHFYLVDNDSMAGTWVNGEQVHGQVLLKEKDLIAVCNCIMIYTDKKIIYNIPLLKDKINNSNKSSENSEGRGENPVVLKADIKTRKVPGEMGEKEKELIRDIKVEIREGTLVALLGGAGAGKSTVMNCLDGFEFSGMEGSVELYGADLLKNYGRMKHLIGIIEQSNRFHPNAVLEKELYHAAVHRLPKDTTKKQINERVGSTLKQLGIENVRKNVISKCSGGEQKRVNIGIELVADRSFLFMDEPDAGLDPGNKHNLFELLRKLAHEDGKTILTIIHDVSDIELFDQVLIMNKVDNVGRLAFFGTPKEAKEYFGAEIRDIYQIMANDPAKYIWKGKN